MLTRSAVYILAASACANAQQLATTVIVPSGVDRPVYMCSPRGDRSRLFVVEQRRPLTNVGRISVINLDTNTMFPAPYLETPPVARRSIEQGCLGMAFHPQFLQNGYFYVVYNAEPEAGISAGSIMLVRYRATDGDPRAATADPASAYVVLKIKKPDPEHNGGWVAFGADGYLYLSTGDGGNGDDQNRGDTIVPPGHTPITGNAQDLSDNLLGKILRLDVDGPDNIPGNADDDAFSNDPDKNYCIPPDNPYIAQGGPEVYHYGLRNPWRCSFDRETGDLWIGDVGQGDREEVDRLPAGVVGANLGWRCMEGTRCTGLTGCTCNDAALTMPIYEYDHTVGCAISGGFVYRGCAMPWLRGTYFFTDYCAAKIWSFRLVGGVVTDFRDRTAELDPPGAISFVRPISFGEDDLGELYIGDLSTSRMLKIVPAVAETDCNANGRADTCDIASGTSADRNGDGVPDECQFICPADFNLDGGVDGADVEAFYFAWEAGRPEADVSADGGIDGSDVEVFFTAWQAGGC